MNPHRATVIVGVQGSGKSAIAREVAGRFGRVVETTWAAIAEPVGLAAAMASAPQALVVEEMPSLDLAWAKAKGMVMAERWVLQRPGGCDVLTCVPIPLVLVAHEVPAAVRKARQFVVCDAADGVPLGRIL